MLSKKYRFEDENMDITVRCFDNGLSEIIDNHSKQKINPKELSPIGYEYYIQKQMGEIRNKILQMT